MITPDWAIGRDDDEPDSERPLTLPERLAWLRRNPDAEPEDLGVCDL